MCSNNYSSEVPSILNRMKMIKFSILLITIIVVQAQSNITTHDNNMTTPENYIITQENNTSTTPYSANNYNYVVNLSLEMREDKIPEYMVSILYDTEYNNFNVSTRDIVTLYKLRDVNLTDFTGMLLSINISVADVISMNGFKECLNALELNFKDVYEDILVTEFGAKGEPLQKFVSDLGIQQSEFLSAMAFGYPDVLEVFQKGNFSSENLQKALSNIGKTNEDLFIAIRDEFLDKVMQDMNASGVAALLYHFNFKETQALMLWRFLNISNIDLYANKAFKNILEHISYRLEHISILGILSGKQYLFLNNISYSILKVEEEIADIIAVTINSLSPLTILGRVKPQFTQLVVLRVKSNDSEDLSNIKYGISNEKLENCALVIFSNNTFVEKKVIEIAVNDGYAELDGDLFIVDEFYLGSPIICDGIVYGLAKFYNGNTIWFDAFLTNDSNPLIVPTETAGTHRIVYSIDFVIVCAFLCLMNTF